MSGVRGIATLLVAAFTLGACNSASASGIDDRQLVELRGTGESISSCSQGLTGTFEDITIRRGETCTVRDAVVNGNIKALEGSRLYVMDTRVRGNIQGDEAAIVHVTRGTVNGDIQISDGRSPGAVGASVVGTTVTGGNIQIEKMRTGSIVVSDARVLEGNIQVVENSTSDRLRIEDNRVGGNLQVFKNAGAGSKTVRGNTVSQDLQCKENSTPFTGGPNSAGDTEAQCF